MIRCLAVAALVLGTASLPAQSPSTQPRGLHLTPASGISPTESIDAGLGKPFPDVYEVTVGRGADASRHTVKNCTDYLTLDSGRHSTGSALNDNSLRTLGATCIALDWLKFAHPATQPSFPNFSFQQITVRELPPELALAISSDSVADAKSASEHGESILKMEPAIKLRVKNADEAGLIAPDWTARLTIFAHADFLGDGKEELLVRWQGFATGGTYTATQVFLLARDKTRLKVVRSRTP